MNNSVKKKLEEIEKTLEPRTTEELPVSYFDLNDKQKERLMFWAYADMTSCATILGNAEMLDKKDYHLKHALEVIPLLCSLTQDTELKNDNNYKVFKEKQARENLENYYQNTKDYLRKKESNL